jgi:hypothetical protein
MQGNRKISLVESFAVKYFDSHMILVQEVKVIITVDPGFAEFIQYYGISSRVLCVYLHPEVFNSRVAESKTMILRKAGTGYKKAEKEEKMFNHW